jgi:hypothetical protein
MKTAKCPRCLKNRFNNSPVAYVWWGVMGQGYMCWKCYEKHKDNREATQTNPEPSSSP